MKKIVIDARGYSTSTGRYVRNLIKYLEVLEAKQTSRTYQVLLQKKEFADYTPQSENFSKLEADFAFNTFSEQLGYLKFIKTLDADLVHFTMPQQPVFYRGNCVTTMHDLTLVRVYPGNKNWLVFKLKQLAGVYAYKKIASSNTYIIAPSQYTKDDYVQWANINPEKVTVTHESADATNQKAIPYKKLVGKKYIMYVGQQSNYKNIWRLMQAHQRLLNAFPELQLVLVGKPNNNGLKEKKRAEQLGYKNIVYTGFVNDGKLAWLYTNCAAYVFPSLMEGFGLPALEAMHYNTPVVSSNATCMPEVLGEAAVYFDPKDVEEMASQIKKVLSGPALQKKLIANGKKQLKKYSWKRMAEQTLELYKKSLEP